MFVFASTFIFIVGYSSLPQKIQEQKHQIHTFTTVFFAFN
jgi:hypothetical protein